MRTQDEKNLEMIYEGLGNYPAGVDQSDNNPSSPYYKGGNDEDVTDQYWDEISTFLSDDWGPVNILDIGIDYRDFIVKFQYQDETDGTVQETTEKIADSDVGANLDPDTDM